MQETQEFGLKTLKTQFKKAKRLWGRAVKLDYDTQKEAADSFYYDAFKRYYQCLQYACAHQNFASDPTFFFAFFCEIGNAYIDMAVLDTNLYASATWCYRNALALHTEHKDILRTKPTEEELDIIWDNISTCHIKYYTPTWQYYQPSLNELFVLLMRGTQWNIVTRDSAQYGLPELYPEEETTEPQVKIAKRARHQEQKPKQIPPGSPILVERHIQTKRAKTTKKPPRLSVEHENQPAITRALSTLGIYGQWPDTIEMDSQWEGTTAITPTVTKY